MANFSQLSHLTGKPIVQSIAHHFVLQAAVALTTIQALRREHKHSSTAGHEYMVTTLNEVLNSPANTTSNGTSPESPSLSRTNSLNMTSSAVQTETTHVI